MRRLPVVVLGLLLVLWPAGVSAQESGMEIVVDASDHPRVVVDVLVPAAIAEREPPGEAFALVENGRLVPAAVLAPAETITEVVLVVDTSGSMDGEPLQTAVAAATGFLDRLPEATVASLITTGGSSEVVSGPGSTAAVADALSGLEADGETALYDGVVDAVALFDADPRTRALLVVLSDGADTASEADAAEAAAAAATPGVDVHAVHLTSPESDPEALAALADAGARVVTTGTAGLEAAYDDIADDVLASYRLEYRSRASGPTEVVVQVTADGTTLTARATADLPEDPAPAGTRPGPAPTTATPTTVAVERTVTPAAAELVPEPDGMGAPWALPAGIAALSVGILAVVLITLRSAPTAREKMADLAPAIAERSQGALSGVASRLESIAQSTLERRGGGLERQLDRAGAPVRPSEYVVGGASLAIALVAAGSMLAGLPGGILAGALGVAAPRLILRFMIRRRQAAFTDQLEGTLQIIGGSLRAGYGLLQAIRTVADEGDPPTSEEFERVVTENRLGRPLVDSLRAMADRLEDDDLRWVVDAVEIQQEIGGDLAEVLDTVAGTIRDRNQIRRQISALSAEGKMSAGILIALPFGIAALIGMISPDYLAELLTTGIGRAMLVAGLVLMGLGTMWIRKIIQVVF